MTCPCEAQTQPHDPLPGVCPQSVPLVLPDLPCLDADYPGDTCDFWFESFGCPPCVNCARRRDQEAA